MRGNLLVMLYLPFGIGSIPAYAGEPATWDAADGAVRVYPRVCGGT